MTAWEKKAKPPTEAQRLVDPEVRRMGCGDVSEVGHAYRRAGTQQPYRDAFKSALEKAGVVVIRCVSLHFEYRFTVRDQGAKPGYELDIKKQWPHAYREDSNWYLPWLDGSISNLGAVIVDWGLHPVVVAIFLLFSTIVIHFIAKAYS